MKKNKNHYSNWYYKRSSAVNGREYYRNEVTGEQLDAHDLYKYYALTTTCGRVEKPGGNGDAVTKQYVDSQ